MGVVVALFAYAGLLLPPERNGQWVTLEYVRIYAFVLGVFFLTFDWNDYPPIRWLSEATYPIYLYHFFFISLYDTFLYRREGFSPILGAPARDEFVLGVALGVFVVWAARRVFGRRSSLLVG
jgi:peptidoglycan/LPS O-acetylase OafA/YrhL